MQIDLEKYLSEQEEQRTSCCREIRARFRWHGPNSCNMELIVVRGGAPGGIRAACMRTNSLSQQITSFYERLLVLRQIWRDLHSSILCDFSAHFGRTEFHFIVCSMTSHEFLCDMIFALRWRNIIDILWNIFFGFSILNSF